MIVRATPADWPELWPIWREVVAAGDTYCYDPAWSAAQARDNWLAAPTSEVWMLRDEDDATGRVLGMYWMGPNQPAAGSHVANASYMVDARVRGRGVGRRLVEHSLARAVQRGFRGLQFNAVVETNTHAIALYEHLGFSVIGRVPGGFRDPRRGYVDLLIMFRPLV